MSEPQTVRAGTTVQWTRALPDYDAGTWTASYRLNAANLPTITITTTGSGTIHSVDAKPATTELWAAGTYVWFLEVTDGTDVFQLDTGTIEVVAKNATGSYLADAKSNLETAEAAYQARVNGGASSYSIKDRSLTRMSADELLKAIDYWRRRVSTLTDAERRRKGQSSRRITYARF
jgi:hypothetical protein